MDLTRLRTLRELSLRHTMSAVADALFLTSSAVSQQIDQLEQEVGVQLTEKRGRGVRLTPAGERLVQHAEHVFAIIDHAKADMAALKKEIAGTLRVAVFPTVGMSLLPAAIHIVEEEHPHLRIVLDELEPEEGLAALSTWRCDLAFVDDLTTLPKASRRSIEKVAVLDDALYTLLPANHSLAARRSLSIADLKDERWALDSAWSSFAEFVLGLCRRAGYVPNINAHCRGFEILAAMVAEGCSVAVVAGLRLNSLNEGVVAVKLRPEVKRRISVAYRSGEREHPAVQVFLDAVARAASTHAGRAAVAAAGQGRAAGRIKV